MPLHMHETSYGAPTIHGEMNHIYVGKFCAIANSAVFDGGMQHHHKAVTGYPLWRLGAEKVETGMCKGDIHIGNDVWIGDGALIMSGVFIGDGAVIGARAVVRHDIYPYEKYLGFREKIDAVVMGYENIAVCRPKKYRFKSDQINCLLKIKWWDWPLHKILENQHLLMSENIDEFIRVHR